jgi:hypothetical protein
VTDDTRTCTKCNVVKPATLDYFYKGRTNANRLTSWCKDCMKALSKSKTYVPANAFIPNVGETKAIAWLKSFGIPANGGKNIDAVKWLDVLAWGCVRIEVKHSKTNKLGIWSWMMYSVNDKETIGGILPHLILFIGEDNKTGQTRYFLFDACHPELFNKDTGKRKINVTYNYQSVNAQNHTVFQEHENKIGLVETCRLKVSQELLQELQFA